MKIRPTMVWALRGSQRTHMTKHRLMSYPAKEVAVCGVTIGIGRLGPRVIIRESSQLTCSGCRKVAPWLEREPS